MPHLIIGSAAASTGYTPVYFDNTRVGSSITLSESDARATSSGPSSNNDYTYTYMPIAGRVYVEIECVTASGPNCIVTMRDDDTALGVTNISTIGGDGQPGFAWRASGTGFSATTPGSFTAGDILQMKIDTVSGKAALAKNNGTYATQTAYAAASGDCVWRMGVCWFAGSSGSFRLPSTPTYTVPSGHVWWGDLPIY